MLGRRPAFFTLAQLAELFHLPLEDIEAWAAAGVLRTVARNGRALVPRRELHHLIGALLEHLPTLPITSVTDGLVFAWFASAVDRAGDDLEDKQRAARAWHESAIALAKARGLAVTNTGAAAWAGCMGWTIERLRELLQGEGLILILEASAPAPAVTAE